MMKKNLLFCSALAVLSSCASIVSHSRWPVTVNSYPVGATVTIVNRKGAEVFSGPTPAAVILKSGSAFFSREIYKLTFTSPGYTPQTRTLDTDVNGWYFGNLFIGGFLGLLIIDPATGAMYRISEKNVQVTLAPSTGWQQPGTNHLQIVSLDDVPVLQRHLLVPVK